LIKRIYEWLFDTDRPLRVAFVCLAIAAGNVYEAMRIDQPNGIMYIVSWLFAAAGAFGFIIFLVIAIFGHFSEK